MKEIRTIVDAWKTIDLRETHAALATVVRVEGSSYRRAGARMLVLDNGTYLGGISGGCLEGDALRRAQKGIALGRPSVITYDTTQDDDYQIGVGLGCQGIIDVLFTPLQPDDPQGPLGLLAGLTRTRVPVALTTITAAADPQVLGKTCLYRDRDSFRESCTLGDLADPILTGIGQALAERASRSVAYGETRVFIEVILPTIHIVAYGGNYDIRTLLDQTAELGWDSTVVLNTARAGKTLVAAATRVLDNKKDPGPVIDDYTAVLLMSHDYRTDTENLQKVLPSPASYIGLLGPRKRAMRIFEALAEAGRPLGDSDLRRIYAPAGLDIGASTPEEIALSILAEVRSHFAGRQGASLRLREGSIYS
ncbi:MAG TPA: XdhC family protein [Puia sp.]|nr:XdhC family protein [Puia sp.]